MPWPQSDQRNRQNRTAKNMFLQIKKNFEILNFKKSVFPGQQKVNCELTTYQKSMVLKGKMGIGWRGMKSKFTEEEKGMINIL